MSDTPSTLVRGGTVLSGGEELVADVLLRDGRIAAVGTAAESGDVVVDATGLFVLPGLVDIHVHGGGGYDAADSAHLAGGELATALARMGTTSFLATSASMDPHATLSFAGAVRAAMDGDPPGAELLGAHLEGPWISTGFRGAHRAADVRPPRADEVEAVLAAARGAVRRVTLAPELDGAVEALALLRENGVSVSIGHSGADAETATAMLDGGATVTHLFNGMAPAHHRSPGIAGAALAHDTALCELIGEGIHVHPLTLRSAARALGDRVLLVSDGLPVMGTSGATAAWYGTEVRSDGRAARLPDGALAGSATTLLDAVRLFAGFTGVPRAAAVRAASEVPARALGLGDRKGSVSAGCDADVALVDASWRPVATWCRGVVAWSDAATLRERLSGAARP